MSKKFGNAFKKGNNAQRMSLLLASTPVSHKTFAQTYP